MNPRNAGFTLIELVVIIVVLGVLSAVAIPSYINLQDKANQAAEEATVGNVRTAIALAYAAAAAEGDPVYPAVLDKAKNGAASPTNPLFVNVLSQGGVTRDWEKIDSNSYKGPNRGIYDYKKETGEFLFVKQEKKK
ncbi:MAG: prepilin-type N-terminal cleavage/methylation domain-containing protein [Planctomycetota bacterium]